ncbi:phosphoglycerate mutase-like protein [Aspergillus pseudonomiae]|uniref:Phosphoglycerate mutase-like protein n=1 Tax=Aspergillus pseudonomiae TaxID=1506151 RepID=A0A5N6I3K9_9EURO|nr:phosphoglycerate mutase-like protein [Aspergillus pseudonomiae]KAB8260300.1 phosphoglycerate mutase-like protein [Aspergillus pseudonomiae]KAE8402336.1 phosphoglycerate mutase-like protein [Aspergillus pseudonomiae]
MPPRIHLVRHAEGLHNVGREYWDLTDPPLTDKGREQCRQLRDKFAFHSEVELIVSSPLCRAISSAAISFGPVFENQPSQNLILLPDLQEISDYPCDIGSEPEELMRKTANLNIPIDYSFVESSWNSKNGRYGPLIPAIQDRAQAVRRWLESRPEREIVVVSHGAFLHFLTEDWEDSFVEEATGWANAEYRTYDLHRQPKCHLDTVCHFNEIALVETKESRSGRGKSNPTPPREEQNKLRLEALKVWGQQGYLFSAAERKVSNGMD